MDHRIDVVVSGALGRMGSTVCAAVLADPGLTLLGGADLGVGEAPAVGGLPFCVPTLAEALERSENEGARDAAARVVVDFTQPNAVVGNMITCLEHSWPVVVGTTGIGPDDMTRLARLSATTGTPALIAPNFALGAVLMMEFARTAARHFAACEVIELHHDAKVDAPSGTARRTADLIEAEWDEQGLARSVPVHSVRLPGLVAHQEVIFGGVGQTLTIRHDSLTRESFMPGVVLAVKRVGALQGLVVGLENIM